MVLLSFLLTGCSATYNVEIYNNDINESIDLIEKTSTSAEDNKNKIERIFVDYFDSTDMLYDRRFEPFKDKKNNAHSLHEKSSYTFEEYQTEIGRIRDCCRSVELSDDGEFITFRALGYFKWFDLYDKFDSIKINIKSNHKVKEHNADSVNRFEYTWNIDRTNYKEKIPSIKLYSNEYVFDYDGKFIKRVVYFVGFTVIILSVMTILYLFVRRKNKNANQI